MTPTRLDQLSDATFRRAASSTLARSERQQDLNKLMETFVDFGGILEQLDNDNSQIIYGRRGTGKTHVLKVLLGQKNTQDQALATYIDVRTLGSLGQMDAGREP